VDRHPFRAAFETRDLETWINQLADDAVAHSPMFKAPFRGRETLAELYDVLFSAFGDFEITDEFTAGDSSAFFWRGEMKGRTIEGVDLLRKDREGKISEITVFIRPLVAIADFGAGAGPPLARRRGRFRSFLARVVAAPLRALFAITDVIGTRLVLRRTSRISF
jgi:hypothetical protein